jgi:hypothetical protein
VTGGWRKLLTEEFHNLYSIKYNKDENIKKDEMGGA